MMEDTPNNTPGPAPQPPRLRGLYSHVNISVGALNVIIAVLAAALVISLLFGLAHAGYTVSFDTLGGTPVPQQTCMYGECIATPDPPTREGYTFVGWFTDIGCTQPWDLAADTVQQSMTLYAAWAPKG